VHERQNLFHATEVLIEDKASGTQLIQESIVDGCYGVARYQPTMDKIMRLHAQTAMIENGFVHIPEAASWIAEYLHEMTVFPNGKHDDQVDSTAQFLDWLKTPMPCWGFFEHTRRQGWRSGTRTAGLRIWRRVILRIQGGYFSDVFPSISRKALILWWVQQDSNLRPAD
jgi:predicted phage terminase large subunit-like protein